MGKLTEPKLTDTGRKDFTKKVQEICNGLTVAAFYANIWLLIGALGFKLYLWIF